MLSAGFPVGLCTRPSLNSSTVRGLMTPRTPWPLRISSSVARHLAWFSGVNSSLTVWPLSIVTRVSIAWPPKRFWYATLSL